MIKMLLFYGIGLFCWLKSKQNLLIIQLDSDNCEIYTGTSAQ